MKFCIIVDTRPLDPHGLYGNGELKSISLKTCSSFCACRRFWNRTAEAPVAGSNTAYLTVERKKERKKERMNERKKERKKGRKKESKKERKKESKKERK